jgi:DNA-binding NarL/FixJ family response regulator
VSAGPVAELPLVVVVEDEPKQLQQRIDALALLHCAPLGFLSDHDARQAIESSPVDLVLTDLHLVRDVKDDKSGVELARYVKQAREDIPVLGYSAVFDDQDLVASEKSPFDEVWPKNLGYREIERLMQRCRELAFAHHQGRRERLWELFLESEMFDMRTIPAAAGTLGDLSERDELLLRYVSEGLAPREIAERLEIEEDELYRFVAWVLDELPPEPDGETMSDVYRRHGGVPAGPRDMDEFERLYGPSQPADDEG